MPRKDPRAPQDGQQHLFEPPTTKDSQRLDGGRHTRAMAGAIGAARAAGQIEQMDDGLATVLMAGAWSLDSFEAQNKPYGPTKVIDQLVSALQAAHMTPDSRDTGTDDEIRALIADLAAADEADPAPSEVER